jgi:hypothetical protein
MLPSLLELELIRNKIKNIPNKQGKYLRKNHYGCYLLCLESGLRISEAVRFDLGNKTKQGLYRIIKPKGKKERLVYVSKEVIRELKANNWKPNQTNRFAFYHFLRKVKQELGINKKVELTPHTLRRAFATYHAEAGLPLPLLSKLLGHSSIRNTALYWQNIYGEDDPNDILAGKKWLEKAKPPAETVEPSRENSEPVILKEEPIISDSQPLINPSSPPIKIESKPIITNCQSKSAISEISPKNQEKFSEPLPTINQKEKPTKKEKFLLAEIQNLKEQSAKVQAENKNLTTELEQTKAFAKQEQERVNYYEKQLKTIAKTFYQWHKIKYYQQLEQERKEHEAKVEQPFKPPPPK